MRGAHGASVSGRLPDSAGPVFQNREKYLLPFLSLQIMDFLLCLLTLLGSYIELPAYLKFASRSSRVVSTQPRPTSHSRPSLGRGQGLRLVQRPGASWADEPEPIQSPQVPLSVRCTCEGCHPCGPRALSEERLPSEGPVMALWVRALWALHRREGDMCASVPSLCFVPVLSPH